MKHWKIGTFACVCALALMAGAMFATMPSATAGETCGASKTASCSSDKAKAKEASAEKPASCTHCEKAEKMCAKCVAAAKANAEKKDEKMAPADDAKAETGGEKAS